jgi:hypothetical protein
VHAGARVRYSSIENWSKDTYNLNTKRALVDENGIIEWVNGNMGSGVTMLYPSSILRGRGAHSDSLGIAFAGPGQNQDTGAKAIHAASVEKELKGLNPDLRIEIDDRDESVGKKIREASMQKSPYMLILGEKEMKVKKIAVRGRGEKDYGVISVKKFAQMIGEEIEKKK